MMKSDIAITEVHEGPLLGHVHEIRKKVFVMEQQVPADLEFEHEAESRHYLALIGYIPAGTARWRVVDGVKVKLERFAVLKEFRGMSVGKALLQKVLADSLSMQLPIILHSQESAVNFYAKNGFEIRGEAFDEAGIVHYKMLYVG